MNTNTPFFRAALTISVLWIATFAYLSYASYSAVYQSPEFAAYALDDSQVDDCASFVFDASKPGYQLRERTSAETATCYKLASEQQVRLTESNNQFALVQAFKSFGWKGLLPAISLLAIVAFWSLLSSGAGRATTGYINWLRFGPKKLVRDNKADDA